MSQERDIQGLTVSRSLALAAAAAALKAPSADSPAAPGLLTLLILLWASLELRRGVLLGGRLPLVLTMLSTMLLLIPSIAPQSMARPLYGTDPVTGLLALGCFTAVCSAVSALGMASGVIGHGHARQRGISLSSILHAMGMVALAYSVYLTLLRTRPGGAGDWHSALPPSNVLQQVALLSACAASLVSQEVCVVYGHAACREAFSGFSGLLQPPAPHGAVSSQPAPSAGAARPWCLLPLQRPPSLDLRPPHASWGSDTADQRQTACNFAPAAAPAVDKLDAQDAPRSAASMPDSVQRQTRSAPWSSSALFAPTGPSSGIGRPSSTTSASSASVTLAPVCSAAEPSLQTSPVPLAAAPAPPSSRPSASGRPPPPPAAAAPADPATFDSAATPFARAASRQDPPDGAPPAEQASGDTGTAGTAGMPPGAAAPRAGGRAWVDPALLCVLMQMRARASSLAHDMKNPLACIMALCEMLASSPDATPAIAKQLGVSQTCAHQLMSMINSARDNLWLMTGTLDLAAGALPVRAILDATLVTMTAIVRDKVKVSIEVPPEHTCWFDEERMKRVCQVMLSNAVKYTMRGSVKVTSSLEDDFLLLSFADTGSGLDAATLRSLEGKDASAQLLADGETAMAVGLRYVARLVTLMGGSVSARNNGTKKGTGCTIVLRLPQYEVIPAWRPKIVLPGGSQSTDDTTSEAVLAAMTLDCIAPPPPRKSGIPTPVRVRSGPIHVATSTPVAKPSGRSSTPRTSAEAGAGARRSGDRLPGTQAASVQSASTQPQPAAVLSPASGEVQGSTQPAVARANLPSMGGESQKSTQPAAGSADLPSASSKMQEDSQPAAAPVATRPSVDTSLRVRPSQPPVDTSVQPDVSEEDKTRMDEIAQKCIRSTLGPTTALERSTDVHNIVTGGVKSPSASTFSQATNNSASFAHGQHLILVVDDDPASLSMFEVLLEQQGYSVLTAASGFEALEVFAECSPKPSCVLLDVTLPDISGHEVCAKLVQMTPGVAVPIIMVSGKNETKDVIRGLKKGAVDYITKPFRSDEVLARLETILRFHSAEMQQSKGKAKQVMEMMRSVFPKHVADLIQKGHRMMIDSMPLAGVLVVSVADFNRMCGAVSLVSVVDELNRLFTAFDVIMQNHGLEKVDVYGDTFIAHIMPRAQSGEGSAGDCVQQMATAAREALQVASRICIAGIMKLEVRVGMHMGPAVGAVLGTHRPKYTLFGPAVSVAMAFQRLALPSTILCSAEVASKLPSGQTTRMPEAKIPLFGSVRPYRVHLSGVHEPSHRHALHAADSGKFAGSLDSTFFADQECGGARLSNRASPELDYLHQVSDQGRLSGGRGATGLADGTSRSHAPDQATAGRGGHAASRARTDNARVRPAPRAPTENAISDTTSGAVLQADSTSRQPISQAPVTRPTLPIHAEWRPPSDLQYSPPTDPSLASSSRETAPQVAAPKPRKSRDRNQRRLRQNMLGQEGCALAQVLQEAGLKHYLSMLSSRGVTLAALRNMTANELSELGLVTQFAQQRLMAAVQAVAKELDPKPALP